MDYATSPLDDSIDETARRRFEADWRNGRPDSLDPYLPPANDPRRLATLEELVHIDLELVWKTGNERDTVDSVDSVDTITAGFPHLVEKYVTRFPDLDQPDILLRLLKQEYRVRHLYGDSPPPEEYRERFPNLIRDPLALVADLPPQPVKDTLPEIPGYEILSPLGQGGMGVVYRARQTGLNRLVALKLIRWGARADADDLARFQTEAEAAAHLQHPNIVQVHEVGNAAAGPFVSLEFVAGGSLDRFLAGVPQPPRIAARVVQVLARAMHHAHERGILHRDLKPANILLADPADVSPAEKDALPWLPKIADFGLAKRLEADSAHTQTGVVLGTPSYMAPEQAAAKKNIGPAVDTYALGAILYEFLTGRPSFRAATAWDTVQQVISDEPVSPHRLQSKTPIDLETICLKCLEKDPARRYSSAAALADDLGRYLRDEPILARPVSSRERVFRWARRNPLVAGLLTALFVTLTAGLIAVTIFWRLSEDSRVAAQEANEESQKQKRAADDSSLQARQAVRDSFTLATEHPAFQGDNMQSARKLLLETAQRYFESFVAQRADDPALKAEVADAAHRLGFIHDIFGNQPEAARFLEQSVALYRGLLQADPHDDSLKANLARSLRILANVRVALGQTAQAREDFDDAIARLLPLVAAQPENVRWQNELALARIHLAGLQYKGAHADQAVLALQETRDRLRALSKKSADFRTYTNYRDCLILLGQVLENRGHLKEAEQVLRETIPIQERIIAKFENDHAELSRLALIHGSLGLVLSAQNKVKSTIQAYEKAIAIRSELIKSNPAVAQYRLDLAVASFHLAELLRGRGQTPQALAHVERTRDLALALVAKHPEVPRYHEVLGLAQLSLHRIHRARNELEKAGEYLSECRKSFDTLLKFDPKSPAYRERDATWHLAAAETQRNTKEYAAARASYQKARAIFADLAAQDAKNPDYQRDQALTLVNLAYLASFDRDYQAIVTFQAEAYALRKSLAQTYKDNASYQTSFANSREYLISAISEFAQVAAKSTKDPIAARAKARTLLVPLALAHPEIVKFQGALGILRESLPKASEEGVRK